MHITYPTITIATSLVAVTLLANPHGLVAQESTRNGALLGGATGAVIGGIIGNNKNDQTAEGALIGGAVGVVAGGLIGHQRDKMIAERQRMAYSSRYPYSHHSHPATPTYQPYQPHRYSYPMHPNYQSRYIGPGQPTIIYPPPVVTNQGVYRSPHRSPSMPPRQPVAMGDVIHLTRSGVSDQVIVSRIQANGMAHALSVDDVIALSQEGVSDEVIAAMQGDFSSRVTGDSEPEMDFRPTIRQSPVQLVPVPPLKQSRVPQRRGF
jgi:hypothetical protein